MSFRIKYWGVRGSLPSAPPPEQWVKDIELVLGKFFADGYKEASQIKDFIRKNETPLIGGFGSHTTCTEITTDQVQVIIDGGSGLRNLGEHMMKGDAGKGKSEIHIFMTHFHWDHLLGMPFFAPHFVPGNVVNYYAVQPDLERIVRMKFSKPMFPVPFESLGATIKFHSLEPRKPKKIGNLQITPYQLDHPDPCWGYKVENGGKVYSHCVDTEGTRSSRESLGLDLPLYQGVDLMYYDAQYTLPELAEKLNWGHSAAQIGLDMALRENVKFILFTHHDPGAHTQQVLELKRQTQEYYDWKVKTAETNRIQLPKVKWDYAYEGMVFDMFAL